jgi:hypothetical protein
MTTPVDVIVLGTGSVAQSDEEEMNARERTGATCQTTGRWVAR